jgi:hypothetical protein
VPIVPSAPGRARPRTEEPEAMLHQAEIGLGREQRVADMRGELERNRLEARLRSARREEARVFFEEGIGSGGRHLIARGTALAMALFR